MANIKALTDEDLYYFDKNYNFELIENKKYILVYCKSYPNRKTIHSVDEGFNISGGKRKLKITKKAIDLWINKYYNQYSLIQVQNAISTLIVTYQSLTENDIEEQLKRKTAKIKEI